MDTARTTYSTLAAIVVVLLPLAACTLDVREQQSGGKAEVDLRTPVGHLSVRTDVDEPATGLPVYPGARPVRDQDEEPENADVTVGTSWFGVKVVAATYESGDAQEKIIDFYRNEMRI